MAEEDLRDVRVYIFSQSAKTASVREAAKNTPDGKHFLIATSGPEPSEKQSQPQFRITLNWFEELKQRVH